MLRQTWHNSFALYLLSLPNLFKTAKECFFEKQDERDSFVGEGTPVVPVDSIPYEDGLYKVQ